MEKESSMDWAVKEFGTAALKDSRWRSRLIHMGLQAVRRPDGKVSKVFTQSGAREGAYGLLECKAITAAQVAESVFSAGARRCAAFPYVYVPVDGSSLTITDARQNKGFGSVGDHVHGGRGLKVISALLVSPKGVPIGLGSQIWWARPENAAAVHREYRCPEEKETQFWLKAMQQTRELFGAKAPQTKLWFQLDREGDAWPIITEAAKDHHWFTIRGAYNRRVTAPSGSKTYLRTLLEALPVIYSYSLAVSAGPNRRERTARMNVQACEVTLDFRDKSTKRHFPQVVNVVLAKEVETTLAGEKPIEWLLLTNRPIKTEEELTSVVLGYAQRWRIEEFHKTWKSGACNVESMQLQTSSAVQKWATILAAVAIRIERLKQLSRKEPNRPASDEFTPLELRAIVLLRFEGKAHEKKKEIPTLEKAVLWVAEIGGYTGRSSGGPPGSITIGRGMYDVLLVARALAALQSTYD